MTVDEAIKELQQLSEEGFGDCKVKVENFGRGYSLADFCITSNEDESEYFIEVF